MNKDQFHISFGGLARAQSRVEPLELSVHLNALLGKRIVFVTDLHYTPRADTGLIRVLDQIDALHPDLVLWGGDYAESGHERFFDQAARIKPPLGMIGVIGNNDREAYEQLGLDAFRRDAARAGIHILINETMRVDLGGAVLTIIGPDEPKHGFPNMALVNEPKLPSEYRILLSHSPLALHALPENMQYPPDLILCGHTHGGQFNVFGLNPYTIGYERTWRLRHFHVNGRHPVESALLVVSNGIGTSTIPMRVGAPEELHIATFLMNK